MLFRTLQNNLNPKTRNNAIPIRLKYVFCPSNMGSVFLVPHIKSCFFSPLKLQNGFFSPSVKTALMESDVVNNVSILWQLKAAKIRKK